MALFPLKDLLDGTRSLAVKRKEQIRVITADTSTKVEAGTVEKLIIYPTPGYLARIVGLLYRAPAPTGATDGNHELSVMYDFADTQDIMLFTAEASYRRNINFGTSGFILETLKPDGLTYWEAVKLLRDTIIGPSGLTLIYRNNTDVAQENQRQIRYILHEWAVI